MPREWKGGRKAALKRYRDSHKEEHREYNRQWYLKNHEREKAKRRKYIEGHREHIYNQNKLWQKNARKRYRALVIQGYGGKCICCGEQELLFLEIHHPDGDGKVDRKRTGGNSLTLYKWLVDNNFPPGYELLCSNCHQGIHQSEDGICPHKKLMKNPF